MPPLDTAGEVNVLIREEPVLAETKPIMHEGRHQVRAAAGCHWRAVFVGRQRAKLTLSLPR